MPDTRLEKTSSGPTDNMSKKVESRTQSSTALVREGSGRLEKVTLSKRQRRILISAAAPITLLGAWCIASYGGFVGQNYLPTPTTLLVHAGELWTNGFHGTTLLEHLGASLFRMAVGFVLAAVLGIVFGLLMGYYDAIGTYFRGLFAFFRPIPPIAFIPLAVIFFGIGQTSKIVLIFYAAFLFMVLNTEAGVKTVPNVLIRAGGSLGLNKYQLFRHVILAGSMPHIISAARTALAISWALVVASELVAADAGLGYMILEASNFFQLSTVYVGIFVVGIVGVIMDSILILVQKQLLHWQGGY